jgi:hypothetical protein
MIDQETPNRKPPCFPVRFKMIQAPEFAKLAPCTAVVLLDTCYRLHRWQPKHRAMGDFSCCDEQWAARLAMSPSSFRDGRRELKHLGWINHCPGANKPRPRSSSYPPAAFAFSIPAYGRISYAVWEALLEALRQGAVTHSDVTCVAVLAYLWRNCGGETLGQVQVPKAAFSNTGRSIKALRHAVDSLANTLPGVLSASFGNKFVAFSCRFAS